MCSCGCGSCGDKSLPRLNGTEVTVLSGTRETFSNRARKNDGEVSRKGDYVVIAAAVGIAAIAYFSTKPSHA
jgi:hypothetical protein